MMKYQLTRRVNGTHLLRSFIDTLPIASEEKNRFKTWTPENYLGDAVKLTDQIILEARMLDQK